MLRRVYLNRRALRQVVRAAAANVSPRRAFTWAGFSSAWVSIRTLNDLMRRLDDVLFPEWEAQRVVQPVFIFANGRSGTTMLHRLLALDEDNFARYKLYQSMFSAVSWQRLFAAVDHTPLLGSLGRRGVKWINDTFFSGWEGIHELGIDKEEEDEATFVLAMESPTISLLNPFMQDYEKLGWLDDEPAEVRAEFMDYYEAVIQKHLFAHGRDKHFLTKNVFTTPRMKTLVERFPDARLVYLIRHPYQALPSWLNLFHEKWVTHSPEIDYSAPQYRELAQMCFAYYRYVLSVREQFGPDTMHFVHYRQLVRDPRAVVQDLYDWMGLEISDAYRAKLDAFTQRQRKYTSKHSYSLEQFGLTKAWIREQIPEVFEAFGFE